MQLGSGLARCFCAGARFWLDLRSAHEPASAEAGAAPGLSVI